MSALLRRFRPVSWIRENPVILKEMRSRMRGWRSFLSLTGFIILLGSFVGTIYMTFASANNAFPDINARKEFGQALFYTIYSIELVAVCLISPSLTAGGIASEKESQTFDLLRTTLLSARALVTGKLLAAISFVLLLLFATLPILSIAFMFGGVTVSELLVGTLILILTALFFGAIGLFYSSFITRARIATVLSQGTVVLITIGLPIFALMSISIIEVSTFSSPNSVIRETILLIFGWLIAIASPVATAVVTELILIEEQSLFFIRVPIGSGNGVLTPSPWLGFVALYPLLTVLVMWLTVRIVRRTARQ